MAIFQAYQATDFTVSARNQSFFGDISHTFSTQTGPWSWESETYGLEPIEISNTKITSTDYYNKYTYYFYGFFSIADDGYLDASGTTMHKMEGFIKGGKLFSLSDFSLSGSKWEDLESRPPVDMASYILSGNDLITGSSYNDKLTGFAGNDVIDGGAGTDEVFYTKSSSNYQISVVGSSIAVKDLSGYDGVDTLSFVESLRFTDKLIKTETLFQSINQYLVGDLGNNSFTGGTGDDNIDGKSGVDVAHFSLARSNYSISQSGNAFVVRANAGTDGVDTLTNIERLQFSDKKVALDVTDNALETLQFIGVIAPSLQGNLNARGTILSLFDQGKSMQEMSQLALDLGLITSDNTALAKTVFKNVFNTTEDPSQNLTNTLVSFIEQNGDAKFLATVAGLNINVDLVGLQQHGMEFI